MPRYQMNWITEVTITLDAADQDEAIELAYHDLYYPGFLDDIEWDCNECMELETDD